MPLSVQIESAVSFQVEDCTTFLREAADVFPIHFAELALNQEKFPRALDSEMYLAAERNRLLHILTARKDGTIIGYIVSVVYKNHPHNASSGPYSSTDMFYLLPEHRNGTGVRLLKENERLLREMGVRRMSISTKLKNDHLDLFRALGFEATDIVFHKVLA